MIRFTHHQHGATHAYSAEEATDLRKRGWKAEGALQAINGDTSHEHEDAVVLPVLDEPPKRKPGRPRKA